MRKCNQTILDVKSNYTKKCKSEAEMMEVGSQIKMYVAILNSQFDTSDFTPHPIKEYNEIYYIPSSYNISTQ